MGVIQEGDVHPLAEDETLCKGWGQTLRGECVPMGRIPITQ